MPFEDELLARFTELEREIRDLKFELTLDKQRIAKFQAILDELSKSYRSLAYDLAVDRQRIAKLESYLATKNNGHRRDFHFLAVELKNEVLRRGKKGMDYKDVLSFFRFRHKSEAYRLMKLTVTLFHEEVRLVNSQKQKLRIVQFFD